jgi:hypothetical protein
MKEAAVASLRRYRGICQKGLRKTINTSVTIADLQLEF